MPLLSRWSRPIVPLTALVMATACASTRQQGPEVTQPTVETEEDAGTPGSFSRPEPGQGITDIDTNGDQITDMVKIWSGPPTEAETNEDGTPSVLLLRKEVDLNHDKKVDLWNWYGPEGDVIRQAYDLDFDGHVDVIAYYEDGVVVRKEVFHSFNGEPDTFKYYEKGLLQRVERDSNEDGRIDVWEYWEGEDIDRIGEDVNGDGNVDKWTQPKQKS